MSSDVTQNRLAVVARNVGKCYHIYDRPQDRLKQSLWRGRRTYYREFWALRNVSFEIHPGETVAIIGRNGSGKSTLLQVIAGTLSASEGEAEVNGRVAALLELGSGFNPEFTGRENVFMNGAILGMDREQMEERFDWIEQFADIGEFLDQPVKTYSSGMYVRLAFAVAASVDPEVLIVDEALAVGDIFFQQKCARHMREQLADKTKLLVTHDMHAVTSLADRVLVLEHGEVRLEAPPREAVEYYTRSAQDNTFRRSTAPAPASVVPEAPASLSAAEEVAWLTVKDSSRSGAGEVWIEQVAATKADGRPLGAVEAGQRILIRMIVLATMPKRDIIFGYLVNDRLGNAIFGDNTCSLPGALAELPRAGRYLVRLEFVWPEIHPGQYTVTLGIGEGHHPLQHVIQCWAHNICSFSCISPERTYHGLLSCPIRRIGISPADRASQSEP